MIRRERACATAIGSGVGGNLPPETGLSLIDDLLAEQRELTAVEKFSRAHELNELPTSSRYRDLLPASAPASGQQYAFEVDLDKCSGCKACVTACHALNGLDDEETWRTVGLLVGQGNSRTGRKENDVEGIFPFSPFSSSPLQRHVTTACHHCVDPGCLDGCPVLAYDKDPVTGIVRHLDDQCIGCQYCVMKCPYEVPQYSARRGIVRKCDMCADRLAVGEAPACVQACPNEAIRITLVKTTEVRTEYRPSISNDAESGKVGKWESEKQACRSHRPTFSPAHFPSRDSRETGPNVNRFLPASPDPSITLPTTRYVSQRRLPAELESGDAHEVRPAKPHLPLTFMLVLSQFAVGLTILDAFAGGNSRSTGLAALIVTGLAVLAGTLHLGQPLKAWRSFLGWRKSWLSRELIAFGAFLAMLGTHVAFGHPLASTGAVVAGLIAVFCSAMVYVDTRRPFWSAPEAFGKFFGTALLLGATGALVFAALSKVPPLSLNIGALLAVVCTLGKLAVENRIHGHLVDEQSPQLSPLNKTALLLNGPLGWLSRLRVACAIFGGLALPAFLFVMGDNGAGSQVAVSTPAFCFCLTGELIERHLFFVAEASPRMPGGR